MPCLLFQIPIAMDHTPKPPKQYVAAFMHLLDTLPIVPKKLVMQLFHRQSNAQYVTFFGYILRIGGILLHDNNFPNIDVQSAEPQLDLKRPCLYIYFNLVKAVYLHYRGATDQAKECCERMFMVIKDNFKDVPDWQMVLWSYWLVHRQVSYFCKWNSVDRVQKYGKFRY